MLQCLTGRWRRARVRQFVDILSERQADEEDDDGPILPWEQLMLLA